MQLNDPVNEYKSIEQVRQEIEKTLMTQMCLNGILPDDLKAGDMRHVVIESEKKDLYYYRDTLLLSVEFNHGVVEINVPETLELQEDKN